MKYFFLNFSMPRVLFCRFFFHLAISKSWFDKLRITFSLHKRGIFILMLMIWLRDFLIFLHSFLLLILLAKTLRLCVPLFFFSPLFFWLSLNTFFFTFYIFVRFLLSTVFFSFSRRNRRFNVPEGEDLYRTTLIVFRINVVTEKKLKEIS